jgi:hypothetical protein
MFMITQIIGLVFNNSYALYIKVLFVKLLLLLKAIQLLCGTDVYTLTNQVSFVDYIFYLPMKKAHLFKHLKYL